jgi:hypothetical protein
MDRQTSFNKTPSLYQVTPIPGIGCCFILIYFNFKNANNKGASSIMKGR